ncbi:MAG: glycosyltransferase [Nanoarchaeota archaeon]|nr:glycosyltransferase [Nanoarchaeota archaeon]
MKKLTVMVPCYNEEKGIAKVISKIPREKLKGLGYNVEVLVIDNNSKDRTTEVAKKAGARVVFEGKQGKGHAIRKGVKSISTDTDLVVMLDGDDTYDPKEMLRLIEPLDSNFCDVVIGSRLSGKIKEGSMTMFNRTGNWLFTFLVRMFYHGNVTDVCTGYFAWKRPVLKELSKHLEANGFSIEMEMITKMAKMKFDIYSVPISYEHRAGDTALKPFGDGKKILHAWMKNLTWKPHAKYVAK